MQNKSISFFSILLVNTFFYTSVLAQEMPDLSSLEQEVATTNEEVSAIDLTDKKMVDFPERTSMGTMEMPPLPDVWETPITGPQPYAESVSPNDLPSEQLKGHITPEVFQEMAELERDTAFLKLQIQKEEMKNNLENVRSNYRQARLDEIAKREEVIRSRIQWWQEQEKLRQEMEKERAEAEEIKNQKAQAEALKAQKEGEPAAAAAAALARQQAAQENSEMEVEDEDMSDVITSPVFKTYTLLDVRGVRGNLIARIKDADSQEVSTVRIGDVIDNEKIKEITLNHVVIDRGGTDYFVKFPEKELKESLTSVQDVD